MITQIIPDFYLLEDFLSPKQAKSLIKTIYRDGQDPFKGFHHPNTKPNRFHKKPKYPVKKYMCYGLYWDPMTYTYQNRQPHNQQSCLTIPPLIQELTLKAIQQTFPEFVASYQCETALINFYCQDLEGKKSSMGLHKDLDEDDKISPIVAINLGSTARFEYIYQNKKRHLLVPHGSVYVFAKSARHMSHGCPYTYSNSVPLEVASYFANYERINITVRKVYF